MCCSDKYTSLLTTVTSNIYPDERWQLLRSSGYLREELGTVRGKYILMACHTITHQCLVSSSVFLELTSCSVCSIPRENYSPHVWEGEGKGKESAQQSYCCLQL